ncbi:MAG: hypothetical protein RLZZ350_1310 [Verrucomicrobiota bacterium]|jgi:PAS domain S-box-containing protein
MTEHFKPLSAANLSARKRGAWRPYLLALGASAVWLPIYQQLFDPGATPMIQVFLLPVILSAYLGGMWPGFLATGIVGLVTNYFLLEPKHSFALERPIDVARWLSMMLIGVLISLITEMLHRARRKAEGESNVTAVTLASIGDAVITADATGKITFLNSEAERLTGWDNAEAVGQPLPDVFCVVNEATRAVCENPVDKILQAQSVTGLANHAVLIARDGSECHIDDSGAPIRRADGKIIGVVLVFRDNTEQKLAEDALRRSELFLQQTSHVAKVGGWEFDPATGEGTWSEEVALIHDLPRDFKPSKEIGLKFYEGESRKQIETVVQRAVEQGVPYDLELELTSAKGVRKFVRTIGRPIIEDGKVVRVCGALQDITARKAEETRIALEQARFKLIFEATPAGIAFHTGHPDGTFTRTVNDAHLRICGLQRGQQNTPGIYQQITHPDDRLLQGKLAEQVKAGMTNQYSMEKRYVHPDGKAIWVNFSYQLEKYPDGTTEELTTVTDITERKRLEDQLRQSQKMEAIGQLAGGVAHDFNNILAIIQLQIGLLESAGQLQVVQTDYAKEIFKATQRAANLTRQLLLFSRKQTLQLQDHNLNEVVTNVTNMLQRIVGEDVKLEFHFSPEPLFVHADLGMMDQVLVNLVVNSRDAMPHGGKLVIETSAVSFDRLTAAQIVGARSGDFVCFTVSDTGGGIPPEVLPRIFDPFFTTKDVGKGTGLGLATVFGIVHQHQGWINVTTQLGRGTTFHIYLPRLATAAPVASLDTTITAAAIQRGSETILLVEDDPALRAAARAVLDSLGYQIVEAASGVEAITVWRQHKDRIDLLLTDLVMPDGITGKELGQLLLHEQPKLKIIYASGYSRDIVGKDFQLTAGYDFLPKPFQAHQLATTVRHRLDHL